MPTDTKSLRELRSKLREDGVTYPRSFAPRTADREEQAKQNQAFMDACIAAEQLDKRGAVALAQRLLVTVDDLGIGNEDFQSAQAVEKYVRQAIRALRGLSLS